MRTCVPRSVLSCAALRGSTAAPLPLLLAADRSSLCAIAARCRAAAPDCAAAGALTAGRSSAAARARRPRRTARPCAPACHGRCSRARLCAARPPRRSRSCSPLIAARSVRSRLAAAPPRLTARRRARSPPPASCSGVRSPAQHPSADGACAPAPSVAQSRRRRPRGLTRTDSRGSPGSDIPCRRRCVTPRHDSVSPPTPRQRASLRANSVRVTRPNTGTTSRCVRLGSRHPSEHRHYKPLRSSRFASMQHATCNMQHETCNMQHATCNMQHATCNMQHAACSMQHATCNMQHATCNMQHATCNMPNMPYQATPACSTKLRRLVLLHQATPACSTTYAACFHHVCRVFPPRMPRVSTTYAACFHHVCRVFPPRMPRVSTTYAACFHHVCRVFPPRMPRVSTTYAACFHHVCRVFPPRRSPSCSTTTTAPPTRSVATSFACSARARVCASPTASRTTSPSTSSCASSVRTSRDRARGGLRP